MSRAWLQAYLSLLVWGCIGLVIALVTRSGTVAIAAGVAYVLIIESVISLVAKSASHWLPGSTLGALAQGGNANVTFAAAIACGFAYAAIGLISASVIFSRREITD